MLGVLTKKAYRVYLNPGQYKGFGKDPIFKIKIPRNICCEGFF